jgi:hypothetical protein
VAVRSAQRTRYRDPRGEGREGGEGEGREEEVGASRREWDGRGRGGG